MQLRSEDSQENEELRYQSDGAVAKKHRAQNSIASLRERLLSVRYDVDKYFHRLCLYTERFTADVTDRCSGFLYSFSMVFERVVEKHCKDIATTMKTDLEYIYVFLRSTDSKLSRSRPPFCVLIINVICFHNFLILSPLFFSPFLS